MPPPFKGLVLVSWYLTPQRDKIERVVAYMIRPNGIIGTPDGTTLYVADHGAGETYKYEISEDGSLSNKTLFVSAESDGMTIDDEGNIYLTNENGVRVYSSSGTLIETIDVTDPTNVCFGGADGQTLFITAKTKVHSIRMRVKGVSGDSGGTESPDYLTNVISALQMMVGLEPVTAVTKDADIDNDGKIGLQEVIYWLMKAAGL